MIPGEATILRDEREGTRVAFKKKILRKLIERAIGKKAAGELFGDPPGCGTTGGCDQDGDGIYDWDDRDRDGDGIPNWQDLEPARPAPPVPERSPENPTG